MCFACSLSLSHALATLQRDSDSHRGTNIFGFYFSNAFFFTCSPLCPLCPATLSSCPFAPPLATVLNALRFNLTAVTPYCFLKRLTSVLAFDDQVSPPHCCDNALPCVAKKLAPPTYARAHTHTHTHTHTQRRHLSEYLAEITIQEFAYLAYKPSQIAGSAVCLALHTLHLDTLPPLLRRVFASWGMDMDAVRSCSRYSGLVWCLV